MGLVAAWRMSRPPRFRPPVPVICVGNFVVGGAGKTPTAIALARIARGRGLKPGFLTRGYGGATKGPLLVDPRVHGPAMVGDEALLLAAAAPTVVARDRAARRQAPDRGGRRPHHHGRRLPEPRPRQGSVASSPSMPAAASATAWCCPPGRSARRCRSQLRRADALIVIGDGDGGRAAHPRRGAAPAVPILRARLKPTRIKEWRKGPILAFAGIGRPEKFFDSLAEIKAPVTQDHRLRRPSPPTARPTPRAWSPTPTPAGSVWSRPRRTWPASPASGPHLPSLRERDGGLSGRPRIREPERRRRDDRRGGAQGAPRATV